MKTDSMSLRRVERGIFIAVPEGIAESGDRVRHALHRHGDATFREPIERPLRFPENDDNQRARVTQWPPPSEAASFVVKSQNVAHKD